MSDKEKLAYAFDRLTLVRSIVRGISERATSKAIKTLLKDAIEQVENSQHNIGKAYGKS